MATADELAELHGQAQDRIGALTVAEMVSLWRMVDVDDLDGSFPAWLAAAVGVITARHRQSATLARRFLTRYRALALPGESPVEPVTALLDLAAVSRSLRVTGPVAVKAAMTRGVDRERAMRTAQVMTSRSAERHALEGGVQTVTETLQIDPRSNGWQRARSAGACDFCSASENQTGSGAFRRHDGCHCRPVPAYQ